MDAVQNNPDIKGSLRSEVNKANEGIDVINARGNLLSKCVSVDSNSLSFNIKFLSTNVYRYPIIMYVASQSNYYTTLYGVIRRLSDDPIIAFSSNDKVLEIVITNVNDTEIAVNITFKTLDIWGNCIIFTWGDGIEITQ